MIVQDLEINKNGYNYRLSNNSITFNDLEVISYDVQGTKYERSFSQVERINGRFITGTREDSKKIVIGFRYDVDRLAYADQLKSRIQSLFSGEFYLRRLATKKVEIPFQSFNEPDFKFDLDYVDGRQIKVALSSSVSFDTSQTSGEFELEFETVELPYFESIAYSTELEKLPSLDKWDSGEALPFAENDIIRQCTFENFEVQSLYYMGDVPINQFNQDFVVDITIGEDTKNFSFATGADSELCRIKGLNLKEGDVIRYDGLQTYRNGVIINDRKYINGKQPTLKPGLNEISFNIPIRKAVFKYKLYFR